MHSCLTGSLAVLSDNARIETAMTECMSINAHIAGPSPHLLQLAAVTTQEVVGLHAQQLQLTPCNSDTLRPVTAQACSGAVSTAACRHDMPQTVLLATGGLRRGGGGPACYYNVICWFKQARLMSTETQRYSSAHLGGWAAEGVDLRAHHTCHMSCICYIKQPDTLPCCTPGQHTS